MTRKIKKYDVLTLTSKENGLCSFVALVLSVKPEGIKLFYVASLTIVDMSLRKFADMFKYKWRV